MLMQQGDRWTHRASRSVPIRPSDFRGVSFWPESWVSELPRWPRVELWRRVTRRHGRVGRSDSPREREARHSRLAAGKDRHRSADEVSLSVDRRILFTDQRGAGETITFHVSTNPASPFRLDIYRLGYYGGTGGRHVLSLGPYEGSVQPDPDVGPRRLRDCQWPACASLQIPPDWLSGVYVGKLTAERDGWQSYVIFIVRDDRRADFLFQCSDTTWQAYNRWPNQYALYDDGKNVWYWGNNVAVSFNRPYGKYCQILDAPLSTGSGEFFLWEFPLAYWLEQNGDDVTYISNLDTHADPQGLLRARGFLSVGHDEYYSIDMFHHLQQRDRRGTERRLPVGQHLLRQDRVSARFPRTAADV